MSNREKEVGPFAGNQITPLRKPRAMRPLERGSHIARSRGGDSAELFFRGGIDLRESRPVFGGAKFTIDEQFGREAGHRAA